MFIMRKIHQGANYKSPEKSFKRDPRRKSCVVPNQSMTIGHILEKYSRGIPVDMVQRDPVYIDQSEFDYEKLNRQDFGEKHAFAQQMQQRAESVASELKERERTQKANAAKAKADAAAAAKKGPGIDPLDNTMPGDTKQTTK